MSKIDEKTAELKELLGEIEMGVVTQGYTLADAIREGSRVTTQKFGWGDGNTACAWSAAYLAARARGITE